MNRPQSFLGLYFKLGLNGSAVFMLIGYQETESQAKNIYIIDLFSVLCVFPARRHSEDEQCNYERGRGLQDDRNKKGKSTQMNMGIARRY